MDYVDEVRRLESSGEEPQFVKLYERFIAQREVDPAQMHGRWHTSFFSDFPVKACNYQKGCLIYQLGRAAGLVQREGVEGQVKLPLKRVGKAYIHLNRDPTGQLTAGATALIDELPAEKMALDEIIQFAADTTHMNSENSQQFAHAFKD